MLNFDCDIIYYIQRGIQKWKKINNNNYCIKINLKSGVNLYKTNKPTS